MESHWGIFIDNTSNKKAFIKTLLENKHPNFTWLSDKKGMLFSSIAVSNYIQEEERHGKKILNTSEQNLRSMSSGEQKKALLKYILSKKTEYIVLDDPFDSLDQDFQQQLKQILLENAKNTLFVQLVSRNSDVLPFIHNFGSLVKGRFELLESKSNVKKESNPFFTGRIPAPIPAKMVTDDILLNFNDVSVSYGAKPILTKINWTVKKSEFWQLIGANGTGKSTLLSMITGDNPKAYGQNISLFGKRKGSGESVWEIKEKLGYFSPTMTYNFNGRYSIQQMLLSGLNDSIGLYTTPTEVQERKIKQWLVFLNLWPERNKLFSDLSLGLQRVVMTVRAMVKHPPLLILDEPTTGMDDFNANRFVKLINTFATESKSTIIYVSHRNEEGLKPHKILKLTPSKLGSKASVIN